MNIKILCLLVLGLALFHSQAQNNTRQQQFNVPGSHVAISGYDPVAYFTDNKAVKGKKEYAVNLDGITYYFSSADHKELFKKEPGRYEPQYGGWCAYAMGNTGEKVSINPETFKIVNGKLYLFYNRFFTNTLETWNKNEKHLQQEADDHWKKIFH